MGYLVTLPYGAARRPVDEARERRGRRRKSTCLAPAVCYGLADIAHHVIGCRLI